jgi:GNAT superfamily N-acetyltransferase
MQDIERAAGGWFREVGMPEIAEDEPLPLEELTRYRQGGRAWVAADDTDVPAAYLIADIIDGSVHIEQVSVHPRAARRKIGRMLLEHAAAYAAARGIRALTLTTFAEVPWNAPYYARCGFRILDDSELSPGMRAVRDREIAHGLHRWPRVCMRRDLGTPRPELGYGTQSLTVFVPDVDAHYQKANSAGATIVEHLHETMYGERQYGARDLDGHHWLFSTHARDVSPIEWGAIITTQEKLLAAYMLAAAVSAGRKLHVGRPRDFRDHGGGRSRVVWAISLCTVAVRAASRRAMSSSSVRRPCAKCSRRAAAVASRSASPMRRSGPGAR